MKHGPQKNTRINKGKVKWYNITKGFGFIKLEEGKDISVHHSGSISPFRDLSVNQEVAFHIKQGDGELATFNVILEREN